MNHSFNVLYTFLVLVIDIPYKNALCNKQFMTHINSYMFRHQYVWVDIRHDGVPQSAFVG